MSGWDDEPSPWDGEQPSPNGPAPSAPQTNEAAADDDDVKADIARLAKLSELDYARERKATGKRLGISLSILDNAVRAARNNGAPIIPGQGRPLELPDPVPWPDHVDGAELLDALAKAIQRYIVLDQRDAHAVALWALATHAFDAFFIFPRLFITAPEKGCGKSTLLDVIERLVPRALIASSITAAALFRTIEAMGPTLLLDEADTFMRDNEDLRGVFDAGHKRNGAVTRTVGDNHEPRQFSVWAPIACAAIGRLHGTMEDRCVIVRLRRRRPDEQVATLRGDRASELEELARKAARWANDLAEALSAADPEMPASIYNRAADNWRPLLAVADLAGGDWPRNARNAAVELSRGQDGESRGVLLLGDIRAAFTAQNTDRIASEDLVSYLAGLDERPWPEFRNGKPITKPHVARLLKPLGISSGTIRLHDGRTAKGYYRSAFEDAFARYLPPFENVTTSQVKQSAALGEIRNVTSGEDVTFLNRKNPSISAGCDVVTVRIPQDWKERL